MRTEMREEDRFSADEEMDNMRKFARVKLEATIKREGKEWRQLLEMFDNYARSSSKEVLRMNEINFILKMN
jgi:hypothetical protein